MKADLLRSSGQRGTALVIALVMLVAMMLLGIAGIGNTSLQVRMGSGIYDRQIAFQAADSAMRNAEAAVVVAANNVFTDQGNNGLYSTPNPAADNFVDRWVAEATAWANGTQVVNGPKKLTPQYIVEDMGEWPDPPDCLRRVPREALCLAARYRITARSAPPGGGAAVVLQSTFRPN